ncbi:hypothetical protein BDN72DRAFT_750877, partial [Pluteus cervinus]
SFKLDLPSRLRQRGIHDAFHASLLRVHVPNDDRLFPGRMETQVADFEGEKEFEWAVERVLSHSGTGTDSDFELKWKSGDITWLPYAKVREFNVLPAYFEVLG